jgi:hypothetical protein
LLFQRWNKDWADKRSAKQSTTILPTTGWDNIVLTDHSSEYKAKSWLTVQWGLIRDTFRVKTSCQNPHVSLLYYHMAVTKYLLTLKYCSPWYMTFIDNYHDRIVHYELLFSIGACYVRSIIYKLYITGRGSNIAYISRVGWGITDTLRKIFNISNSIVHNWSEMTFQDTDLNTLFYCWIISQYVTFTWYEPKI